MISSLVLSFPFFCLLWVYFACLFLGSKDGNWRLQVCDFSSFLICATSAIDLPLKTALDCNFWYSWVSFSLISVYLLGYFCLTLGLFRRVLFSFQVFGDFTVIFMLLISNFVSLWSKITTYMISILLSLLKIIFWPRICYILIYVSFHWHLKRMHILVLDGMFYKCQLDPLW